MTHILDTGGHDPARMPAPPPTAAEEFLSLMEQRRRLDARLGELLTILDDRQRLPLSGLKPYRRGAMLFKGGRL